MSEATVVGLGVSIAAPVVLVVGVGVAVVGVGVAAYQAGAFVLEVGSDLARTAADEARRARAERLRIRRVEAELERLNDEFTRLQVRADRLREAFASVQGRGSAGELPTFEFRPDSPLRSPQEALSKLREFERALDDLSSAPVGATEHGAAVSTSAQSAQGVRRAARGGADRSAAAEEVAAILSRLHLEVPAEVAELLSDRGRRCAALGRPTADGMLQSLRGEVAEANEAVRSAASNRNEIRSILDRIAGFRGERAERLRGRLDRALGDPAGFEDFREEALAEVEWIEGEWNREYIASVLADALEEAGYEVQEGFETLTADGQDAYLRHADWSSFAVRSRLDGPSGQVSFELVRQSDHPTTTTAQAQTREAWCTDLDGLRDRLGVRGLVAVEVERHEGPLVDLALVDAEALGDLARADETERPAAVARRLNRPGPP